MKLCYIRYADITLVQVLNVIHVNIVFFCINHGMANDDFYHHHHHHHHYHYYHHDN